MPNGSGLMGSSSSTQAALAIPKPGSQTIYYLFTSTDLAKWHEEVRLAGFKSFNTISRTIETHYLTILNYFDNRRTNASAESFNAKIKSFRTKFRGVSCVEFFLFRLTNLYA
jgi:hypothetical protein